MYNNQNYSPNKVNEYQSEAKQSQVNEISMYENSYNARVLYSRKLYAMLLIQMIVIGTCTYVVHLSSGVKLKLQKIPRLWMFSLGAMVLVSILALIFRKSCKSAPLNYITYLLFTLSAALFFCVMVALTDSQIGLLVFASLASIIFFLFVYSLTVKKRLSYQGSTLFLCGSILMVFELFTVFSTVSLFWLMIVSLGSFLFAYFLIYDTQTNVNSGDRYDISMEDEVSGSVIVYWDVIILFLHAADMIKNFIVKERN